MTDLRDLILNLDGILYVGYFAIYDMRGGIVMRHVLGMLLLYIYFFLSIVGVNIFEMQQDNRIRI